MPIMCHHTEDLRQDYQAVIPAHGLRAGYWADQLAAASDFHTFRAQQREASGHLIVVAAQHPLVEGTTPGPEFTARLDTGADLHDAAWSEGEPAEIYVPGSRHRERDYVDEISLADAGANYLADHRDISDASLHSYGWVALYGKDGQVYNGADEAASAATAFQLTERFRDMTMVVSPGQRNRAMLHLLANGVMADMVVPESLADSEDLYHDGLISKALETYTRRFDPTWQGSLSIGAVLRMQRQPRGSDAPDANGFTA